MEFKTPAELAPKIDVGFVGSMLGKVFGFNSPIYLPYELSTRMYIPGGYDVQLVDEVTFDRLSQFGTPVVGSFTIAGGNYRFYDLKTGKLKNSRIGDFEFPIASLVEFSRSKNIIKTPTIGGVGSVKEIYGLEDWSISIKGICMPDSSRKGYQTTEEQIFALTKLNEIAGSLEIAQGNIFLKKNISRLVIESLAFSPVQGKPDIMPFEITATSDEDLLLTL